MNNEVIQMIGITSYGGYIPRLRINRSAIVKAMGWFAPGIASVAQGEKSIRNWDEDTLTMAVEATRDCLTGVDKYKIDALYAASTTMPYADRQNAGILKTAVQLRNDITTSDFGSSQKCGTGAISAALDAVKAGSRKQVMVTASEARETKGASNYEMVFGDGAASLLFGEEGVIAEFKGAYSVSYDFVDHYRAKGFKYDYIWEDRWVRDLGYGRILPEAIQGLLKETGQSMQEISKVVYPCFFKAEHKKIAKIIGAANEQVQDNMHEVCGETGCAHPLVMLVAALEQAKPGDKIIVAGFGQGSDALLFQVTDNIDKIPKRRGISGSLADRKEMNHYQKLMVFRGLYQPDMGLRAEGSDQTSLTVLWRHRDMLFGLVGGKCRKCGTPQYPGGKEICINPECGAFNEMDRYEFADKKAKVLMFSGDYFTSSLDPPLISGVITFDGGGRMVCDFIDCEMNEIKVGTSVRMVFRKRRDDKERGIQNYFWKAVPVRTSIEGGE
jgi:3-hydroxy-3-methylglutaryl CoA synthase